MQTHYKELSDTQWQVIKKVLEADRKRSYSLRSVVNSILKILRTGVQWRNLQVEGLKWELVYYYFRKWQKDGTLQRLNDQLNQLAREKQGKQATPSLVCIDSQSIKTAPFISQAKGIDGNKRINGRKRHLLVDTLGLIWGVVVSEANVADGSQAPLLVEHCLGYLTRIKKIAVDMAYKKVFQEWIENNIIGIELVFSGLGEKKPNAFKPIQWRWVNERTFAWFNFFRRLAKDYEKTPHSAEGWILWANCLIIINRL